MNRVLLLFQGAATAVVLSSVFVVAHRSGGRTYVYFATVTAIIVLQFAVFRFWPDNEGPAWLTAVALILPVLAIAFATEVLASREEPAWVQVAGGCIAGLLAYLVSAVAAYVVYMIV